MRLIVQLEGDLYRLWVEHRGHRFPLLVPGDRPSWAGGWAGTDGIGAYELDDAVHALATFGLRPATALHVLRQAQSRRDA